MKLRLSRCPVCEGLFFEDHIFDHLFSACIEVESAEDVQRFLNKFSSNPNEGRNFNAFLTCFLCSFETMYSKSLANHMVSEHVEKCSCGLFEPLSIEKCCDHFNAKKSTRQSKGKCFIICPICQKKEFNRDSIANFEGHLLICSGKTEITIDTGIHQLCLLCKPPQKILCTDFLIHLADHKKKED